MEIKTAEIVEKRETSTETTMREKLGISCCAVCYVYTSDGFPSGWNDDVE